MATVIERLVETKKTCTVTFADSGKTVECAKHTNLRDLAIQNDLDLYNGLAKYTNCEGMGLCGTCAVEVKPHSGVTVKGAKEKFRFLQLKGNLRLSCQCLVLGDIEVTKHSGMFGTKGYSEKASAAEVTKAYEAGKTIDELSGDFELHPAKVAVLLEKSGVEVRKL
jgi:ferredoxin